MPQLIRVTSHRAPMEADSCPITRVLNVNHVAFAERMPTSLGFVHLRLSSGDSIYVSASDYEKWVTAFHQADLGL